MNYDQITIIHGKLLNISDCQTTATNISRKIFIKNYKRITLKLDDKSRSYNQQRTIIVNESNYSSVTGLVLNNYYYFICDNCDNKGTNIFYDVSENTEILQQKMASFFFRLQLDEDKRLEQHFKNIENNKRLQAEYIEANEQYREIFGIKEEIIEEYPF